MLFVHYNLVCSSPILSLRGPPVPQPPTVAMMPSVCARNSGEGTGALNTSAQHDHQVPPRLPITIASAPFFQAKEERPFFPPSCTAAKVGEFSRRSSLQYTSPGLRFRGL